jgi:hypothetical protein
LARGVQLQGSIRGAGPKLLERSVTREASFRLQGETKMFVNLDILVKMFVNLDNLINSILSPFLQIPGKIKVWKTIFIKKLVGGYKMMFPIYRFRLKIIVLIISVAVFLSFPVQVGMTNVVHNKSKRAVPIKKVWVQKHIPLKKSQSVKDITLILSLLNSYSIHAKIKSVITDYKTVFNDNEKNQISKFILKQSKKYGFDPLFLTALIITESSFNHMAESKVGALGLMQIRPRTGKAMASETNIKWQGKRTLYQPESNIALGSFYLNKLIKRFGDMKTALEAYNHGPTRTAHYLRRGKRTKDYSDKVFTIYNQIRLAKANV